MSRIACLCGVVLLSGCGTLANLNGKVGSNIFHPGAGSKNNPPQVYGGVRRSTEWLKDDVESEPKTLQSAVRPGRILLATDTIASGVADTVTLPYVVGKKWNANQADSE